MNQEKTMMTRYKLKKLISVNNSTMAPNKAKKHNTRSVTGATGHKLMVNLKNNLAKGKTNKTVTPRQQSKKVGKTKSAPALKATPARSKGARALQADLPQMPGFLLALEQMHNLYTILTHNSAGQAQNPVKAVDCTKKNQNFNSKSGTKMASGQESDLVTVNRDVFVGSISNRHGDGDGCGEVDPVDADQGLPPDDVEQHHDGLVTDMDINEDDVLPSPPPGRPHDLVAAVSAPQSALQLLSPQDTLGKRHMLILAKHVKEEIKRKIWANSYVDLSDLLDRDKDDQPLHVTQSNTGLLTFKKTKINKVDSWAMWNKMFHIFIEIYCLKFPSKSINLIQYSGILNILTGKFPFAQVYNYDKDFRQQME